MPYQNLPQTDYSGVHQGMAILARGASQLGEGIGRVIEKNREQAKRVKAEAQGYRQMLKGIPETERPIDLDSFESKSFEEQAALGRGFVGAQQFKEGVQRGALMKEQIDRAQQQYLAEDQRMVTEQQQATRLPDFMRRLSELGTAPEDVPSPLSEEAYRARTAPADLRGIMGAAAASGYNLDLRTLDDILRAANAGKAASGWNLQPGQTIDYGNGTRGVATSPNSTQIVTQPAAKAPGELEEVMMGGKPTGWLRDQRGRYIRKHKDVDPFEFTKFDSNGDGELNPAEAAQATLAQTLGAKGIAYPGMKVGKGKEASATPAGGGKGAKPDFRYVPGQGLVPVP